MEFIEPIYCRLYCAFKNTDGGIPMKIKKLIAPIIIIALLLVYLAVFIISWYNIYSPILVKVIGIIIGVFLMGGSIFVLIERIKEVRSGEEDDLGKY